MKTEIILDRPGFAGDEIDALLEDITSDAVEVVITDPGYMRVLNRQYRKIDSATDVISFDLADSPAERPDGVIYVDGRLYPPMEAVLERIFHGYFHLLGFTHDTDEEETAMKKKVRNSVNRAMKKGGRRD